MRRIYHGKFQVAAHLREKYSSQSHQFLDWVRRLGFERTLFGRIVLLLEEKYEVQRLSYLIVFSTVLAFAVSYEGRNVVRYNLGEITKTDVISPVSFELVDEVTTEEKRMKAEKAVPIIFDYDSTVFEKVSGNIYRSFRLMRTQLKNAQWPQNAKQLEELEKDFLSHKVHFEKELNLTIPDYLFEWLIQQRFSAFYENIIIRNLEMWYQEKIGESVDKYIPNNQSIVIARSIQKNSRGREFPLKRSEIFDISNPENFELKEKKGLERSSPRDIKNMQKFVYILIIPNLTLNKQEISHRRQIARDSVLPVTVTVKKNQIVIPEGSIIQPLQIAIIKQMELLSSRGRQDLKIFGIIFTFVFIIFIFYQYLRRFTLSRVRVENKDIVVMSFVSLIIVVITKLFLFLTETALISKFGSNIPVSLFLYASPVAAGPMLVGLLISSGEVVWLFSSFLAIVLGFMTDADFAFMVVTFIGGIAAARGVYGCKKRNDIYWAGLRTGIVNIIMIVLITLTMKWDQPDFIQEFILGIPAGLFGGIFSSMVAMMLIPFLESVFNYTTDIKLLELSNLNHPLLKEMIVKAPGTYHHSILVGSMVEAAAEEIGANSLLGKVMSYYHDIGKMAHSHYFIENQKPGNNSHDHISPYMSKTLLISHVKDGVEIGMKYHLGKPIIDAILQHHGTSLISYFYNKAMDLKEGEEDSISEDDFRYPGPKPQFREAALCMLADSIEAAARSLDEPTPVRLQNIVKNIVQRKFIEGQLNECGLTLRDLSRIETAFVRILLGIYHQRIDYPKSAGGGASEN